jgi:hypothetical protein
MGPFELSEVQLANLNMLVMIRDFIKRDALAACCCFGLSQDLVQFVTALSSPQLFSIVVNIGNECLFLPRQDLVRLLSLPLPLLAPMFAVHPPRPAPAPVTRDAPPLPTSTPRP